MQYRQITHESVAAAKAYLIRLFLSCAFPLFQNKYWYINYDHYVWQAEIIFYVQVQSDCLIKQTHIQRNSKALHLGPVFWNRDKWQVLWNGLSTRCMHSPWSNKMLLSDRSSKSCIRAAHVWTYSNYDVLMLVTKFLRWKNLTMVWKSLLGLAPKYLSKFYIQEARNCI